MIFGGIAVAHSPVRQKTCIGALRTGIFRGKIRLRHAELCECGGAGTARLFDALADLGKGGGGKHFCLCKVDLSLLECAFRGGKIFVLSCGSSCAVGAFHGGVAAQRIPAFARAPRVCIDVGFGTEIARRCFFARRLVFGDRLRVGDPFALPFRKQFVDVRQGRGGAGAPLCRLHDERVRHRRPHVRGPLRRQDQHPARRPSF